MSQQLTSDELHKRQIMEELKRACIEGDLIEVRKYMCTVKQDSFPLKKMEAAIKPLAYWAAKAGQLDVLKELIDIYKCDPHYTTERGQTLLYVACSRGHADVMKYLASKCHINPKQANATHSTPLFVACNNGHLEAMLVLIDDLKCDPNAVNDKGESLLHRACGGGHLEVVKSLITKYHLSPEARSVYMDTPLHDACAKGKLEVAQYLIETHGCKISVFNKMSLSPLHIACRNGHANVVHYLVVEQNCDVAPYDNSGSTPLHLACKFRRKSVVRVLLDSGRVNPNLPTLAGEVPIMTTKDPDIVRYLIRSGAKPVGGIPSVLEEFVKKAPLDSLVHIFMIGHSEAGKSTLAQALQMTVTTSLGGLIARANTVTNDPGRTAGIIPMEFKSPDFGRVLLYDFAGHPEYHASHGALLEHFNTNTAPLFLLVVDLNEGMTDVVRKLDYWLSFVDTHRLPGVSPPRVMIIGSHYDLLKKKSSSEEYMGFIARLEEHIHRRFKQSKPSLDGFFPIDCRDPKKHRELRQRLKLSCEGLRVHERIDSCCHVLNVFLTKEFDKQLACKIEDIVKKIRESEAYPIPMQVNRLCDLAEEVSTRMKILFLRNKESPEKSWIVLDIDTLLSKINGFIFASEKLPEHCLTPTHTGVLPLSQIQRHLPRELDPSLVVSFLGRLEFCQVVQDPEVLSLIRNGKSDTLGMADSDDEVGSLAHHRQSFCSQMSTSSCQTCSSGVSSHTTGSGVSAEYESKDGVLESNWTANLFTVKTSPQRHTQIANSSQTDPQSHAAPPTSSSPGTELPPSQVPHQFTHPSSTAPLQQQPGNPLSSSPARQYPLASQQHQPQNEATHFVVQNAAPPQPNHVHVQQHTSQQQFASSPTIVTPPSLHTPTDPQQIFSPTVPGSSAGELLSPVSANTPVSHSLTYHSHLIDHHERRRQISSPPFSQVSKLHEQFHNLHLTRGMGGGSQPSLPEEQSKIAAGGRPYGAMHRSPSDSCTLSSGQSQHQCNSNKAQSHGGSPRASRHMGYSQSPVFNHDQFLFFPGLVNSGQPSGGMWLRDESFVFYSGWCLESAKSHKFFTPRFLQTLILRLAFGFAVSRRRSNGTVTSTSTLALFSRECTIWKNGLRWLNLDGVETFVELVEDGRALLLLMRAKMGSELRGVNLRSALIRKILDTKEECCPGVPTEEYLIHPKHLKERESYPIITGRLCDLTRYDITIVAKAIVGEKRRRPHRFAIDTHNTNVEPLANILYFDPYMCLNSGTLRKLFDTVNQDEELLEDLLLEFSEDYPNDADKFKEILLDDSHYNEQNAPPNNNQCFGVLRRYWDRAPNLKISDFRRDLDRHSIFSGRNILCGAAGLYHKMDDIPELIDLLNDLHGKAVKWYDIGIQLHLSTEELDAIKYDSKDVNECFRNMLKKWRLKTHPPPTWRALIIALKARAVDEQVLAEELEIKLSLSRQPSENAECETSTSVEVTRQNLIKIQQSFAKLLKAVAENLKSKELDLEVFRFFVVALFPPGRCIPQSSKVVEIFEAVTTNGLWSYWHYTPVEKIVAEYAPNDDEMKGLLDKYKKELSGYKAMTKIADVIELYKIDEFADPSRRLTVAYDPAYLQRLSLKLKTRVTDKSLEYVDELWVSLAEYFLLPSLSVLLENIRSGCIEVSWLIPPHFVSQIIGNLQENSGFLESKGIIKVLVDGNCYYDEAQDEEFKQKLISAVSAGNIDEMVAILTSGIDINTTLDGSVTLLMFAAYKKLTGVLAVLLDYGADIDMINKDGWTALMLACEQGNLETVEMLLEHNAGVEIKTLSGWTALMIACENGHLDIARVLVEKQANVNCRNKKGHTCLMAACQNNHLGVVKFLLTLQQIDINIKDEKGINALMYASHGGNLNIIHALLNHPDVDINEISDDSQCTALMFACFASHLKCAELLLSRQADVSLRDQGGWTALTFCCMRASDEGTKLVQLLLRHKADPNAQDEDGWTPLMTASTNDLGDVVHELLKAGADPNIRSKLGRTAFGIARDSGSFNAMKQLEDCTTVETTDTPIDTSHTSHPERRGRQVQLGLTHSDYRAGLENRRIFREILERGSEVDDQPKAVSWQQAHQQEPGQGEHLPESQ